MSILQKLYDGNLNPGCKTFRKGSSYEKALTRIVEQENYFCDHLPEADRLRFEALMEAQAEIVGITGYESFLDGFRLGAGFTLESFVVEPERSFQDMMEES